jgi:hypothetical protein
LPLVEAELLQELSRRVVCGVRDVDLDGRVERHRGKSLREQGSGGSGGGGEGAGTDGVAGDAAQEVAVDAVEGVAPGS